MGVERDTPESQGAGDQGMMFGYATTETENYMPISLELSHKLLMILADIRKEGKVMTYLRPDSKSQVTVEYNKEHNPVRIDTVVVSTQHDDFGPSDEKMLAKIKKDVTDILLPRVGESISGKMQELLKEYHVALSDGKNATLHVNPTGKFVIGGPHGDTGLTGRKIIVDTYGGMGRHGGGAFSGKDPSKVDRSAAYMARYVAKNIVAAELCDRCEIEIAYAIGVPQPISVSVDSFGTAKVSEDQLAKAIRTVFDLRPAAIIKTLDLKRPIYQETASYGHFGRDGFSWEKTDQVEALQKVIS